MLLIEKFLQRSVPAPREIAQVKLPVDDKTWRDIQERIEVAKRALGDKYLCHPTKRVQRQTEAA